MSSRIEELFWHAKQLEPGPVRQRFLRELDQQDSALAVELRRLLEADVAAEQFFGVLNDSEDYGCHQAAGVLDSLSTQFNATGSPSTRPFPSNQIGPYKLLEPIGEGGMGLVYLAKQLQPVRRKVALKIIKPGMDSRQVIARFEAERQALAIMEHPNIAKVLDAGTTESGLPYFAMELVCGIPITEYCGRKKMTINQRLALFCDACAAIQHAHNKGVIHRDIKPSNVLVTEQDGKPLVKVIDFGIAKALRGNLTDKSMFTGVFQLLGTPLYMSPEQASLSNVDVDTRSDVYSLGVLLYELLSGNLPISRDEIKGLSFEELRQRICDTEPLRPSKRLSTLKDARDTTADQSDHGLAAVQNSISSELDWIVMKAINKDRGQRYQSPRLLAEDVCRYLNGEEVSACPPRMWYLAKKRLKKYRKALIVTSVVACSLLAATIVSVYWAIKATRASDLAEESLSAARLQKQKLAEFLYSNDMTKAATLFRQGDHARMREAMERHVEPERDYLRGFEWYFTQSLSPVPTQSLSQIDDRLNDFVICDGGKTIVTGDSADRIFAFDKRSGQQLVRLDTGLEQVHDLELLNDGRIIASGDGGKIQVYRWDRSRRDLEFDFELVLGDSAILSLAIEQQGSKCWAGSHGGHIFEIDIQNRKGEAIVHRPAYRQVRDLEVTAEGLLVAGQSGDFFALSVASPTKQDLPILWRQTPGSPSEWIMDVDVAAETRRTVVGTTQGLVTVLDDAADGGVQYKHLLPRGIHSVAITADGKWVAAGDSEGRIHLFPEQVNASQGLFNQETARRRRVRSWLAHDGKIEHLQFERAEDGESINLISVGRDGRVVVSSPLVNLPVKYSSVSQGEPFSAVESDLLWAKIGLQSNWLAEANGVSELRGARNLRLDIARQSGSVFAAIEGREILQFSSSTTVGPKVVWRAPTGLHVDRMAPSDDGAYLAICVREISSREHSIHIYNSGQPQPLATVPSTLANDLAFSPDNAFLAYVHDNNIDLISTDTGAPLHTLVGHRDSVHSLAFSPDGTELASVSSDGRLIVWDCENGKSRWVQQAHENRATAVAWHPTLNTIATVGDNAVVRFWSSRRQVTDDAVRLVGEFPLAEGRCEEMRFSSNGQSLFIFHARRGVTELSSTYSRY